MHHELNLVDRRVMPVARIAVFDSGLGSLGVVRAIRAASHCDIIYYADTASHPYGAKSVPELHHTITNTIHTLQERFAPDLVVVGSNTPTLLLDGMEDAHTIGVWPPVREAARLGHHVTALATRSVVEHAAIDRYARRIGADTRVHEVDATRLVRMAETGQFLDEPERCRRIIQDTLQGMDGVCILASTHLPFLRDMMEAVRPDMTFLDPAETTARRAVQITGHDGANTLQVYDSGGHDIAPLLRKLGVYNEVRRLHAS